MLPPFITVTTAHTKSKPLYLRRRLVDKICELADTYLYLI
ncbi:hypothetical protein GCWU000322_00631 [Eubacterium saphenum ATCC 49989]|nr:hypothetical protein GCWU000322_00631 [Eubacterium saphenum ATCC 49989]